MRGVVLPAVNFLFSSEQRRQKNRRFRDSNRATIPTLKVFSTIPYRGMTFKQQGQKRKKERYLRSALDVTKKWASMAHSDDSCSLSTAISRPSKAELEDIIALSIPGSGRGSSAIDLRWPRGGGWFSRNADRQGSCGKNGSRIK